jgi:purine/pyrimidine-nucleoside phosphorylase
MPTDQLPGTTVTTKANVYFGGKCVSYSLMLADGSKKSVGVILPATLTFNTGAAEIMECVAGACDYKLAGASDWVTSSAGDKFNVPANSRFEIRVAEGYEAYHYICHFG